MLQVSFTGSLQSVVGDTQVIEVEARTIRELMSKLVERFPGLSQHIEDGVAVAINGEIYRDNWEVEIATESEVFLMPRIPGG